LRVSAPQCSAALRAVHRGFGAALVAPDSAKSELRLRRSIPGVWSPGPDLRRPDGGLRNALTVRKEEASASPGTGAYGSWAGRLDAGHTAARTRPPWDRRRADGQGVPATGKPGRTDASTRCAK